MLENDLDRSYCPETSYHRDLRTQTATVSLLLFVERADGVHLQDTAHRSSGQAQLCIRLDPFLYVPFVCMYHFFLAQSLNDAGKAQAIQENVHP